MDRDSFCEELLSVMDGKQHWAWSEFTSGRVPADRLHIHLEQEYAVYVRDFPVLVARAYVQCPLAVVRRELIENVYEEETGGLAAGRPHPDLFLEVPSGLGMDLARFNEVTLLPEAQAYRASLDQTTQEQGWAVAAAVTTLFLEGTAYERGEVDPNSPKRPQTPLEEHPLVVHYGLPQESLSLTRAHREVEGLHRAAAWKTMLDYVPDPDREAVVEAMKSSLARWLSYRDAVAAACGVARAPEDAPSEEPRRMRSF